MSAGIGTSPQSLLATARTVGGSGVRSRGALKQDVCDKRKVVHAELAGGLKVPSSYTVQQAVDDWLRDGLDDVAEKTRKLYAGLLGSLMEFIGKRQLRELSASDVRDGLVELADRFSTRSMQITRNSLKRLIHAASARSGPGP
jgi:hypothetical protein